MLTDALCDSIRRLLGVDATTVPNTMILDPLLGGAVMTHVQTLVGLPRYIERPLDQQGRMDQAVAFLVAARLLGTHTLRTMNGIDSERFTDQYQVSRNAAAFDLTGWQRDLERQADDALAPLLASQRAVLFSLAAGRRGA